MSVKHKKISMISLGCSKNLVDSEFLVGGLKHENYTFVDDSKDSDIIIVNTCGFLDKAREEGIETILEAAELRTSGEIDSLVVMGCFSERFSTELRQELPEVDEFFGTTDHKEIISYITGKDFSKNDPDYQRSLLTPTHYAYLKIAEGCDNGCTFCSIPLMRGLQKSQPVEWNIMEAKRLVKQGVKELLVIAQDSTSYGWDLSPKSSLHEMMYALDEIDGLEWIRLHYAHPAHLHRNMINAYSEFKRVIPYIDMPVQHASDRMLTLMRRGLKSDGIKKRIDSLRKVNPNIAIRTSIIVGFPGETEDDFQQLMDMVEEVQFDRLGVFTYSEEDGTYAEAHMKDDIPRQVKEERFDAVMRAQQVINLKKNQSLVGETDMVIVDKITDEGWSIARSYRDAPEIDNHIQIKGNHPEGEFLNVKYTQAYEYDLLAEVINA